MSGGTGGLLGRPLRAANLGVELFALLVVVRDLDVRAASPLAGQVVSTTGIVTLLKTGSKLILGVGGGVRSRHRRPVLSRGRLP